MKAVQSRNIAMSDFFRAFAGAPESQFDMIACTVYSAAYSLMQAGNKTQFNKLIEDAKMYGSDSTETTKRIKELLGVKTVNATVKHFRKTYFALQITLDHMGVPSDMQKELPADKAARHAVLDPLADAYATEFASHFVATVSMPEKTEAERTEAAAAAKVKREAKAKAQAKELQQTIKTEAEKLAGAREVSLSEMARIIADAMRTGALDADTERMVIGAAQLRETQILLARAASGEIVADEPETA
jgi:hypothetical protein